MYNHVPLCQVLKQQALHEAFAYRLLPSQCQMSRLGSFGAEAQCPCPYLQHVSQLCVLFGRYVAW